MKNNEIDIQYTAIKLALLLLIGVLMGAIVALGVNAVKTAMHPPSHAESICGAYPSSFECRDYQVQQCVASDQYTREECIALIGNGSK